MTKPKSLPTFEQTSLRAKYISLCRDLNKFRARGTSVVRAVAVLNFTAWSRVFNSGIVREFKFELSISAYSALGVTTVFSNAIYFNPNFLVAVPLYGSLKEAVAI